MWVVPVHGHLIPGLMNLRTVVQSLARYLMSLMIQLLVQEQVEELDDLRHVLKVSCLPLEVVDSRLAVPVVVDITFGVVEFGLEATVL